MLVVHCGPILQILPPPPPHIIPPHPGPRKYKNILMKTLSVVVKSPSFLLIIQQTTFPENRAGSGRD